MRWPPAGSLGWRVPGATPCLALASPLGGIQVLLPEAAAAGLLLIFPPPL